MNELASQAVSALVSLGTGALVFFALPRGAVLVRSIDGPDRWRLSNNSAVPIRVVDVELTRPANHAGKLR